VSRANAACASSSTTAPTSRSPIGADGVHLGQDDLDPVAARRLLGERFIIGYSTHTVAQAIEAARLPVDYIALGPIFDTAHERKPRPPQSASKPCAASAIPSTHRSPSSPSAASPSDTARAVLDAGADSVALVSALLAAPDLIAKRTKELRLS
jgi:thiamine-phosphate diphosphorylase